MYQRIVVPLDGSGFSERALPQALRLAEHTEAVVVLIAVAEPAPRAGGTERVAPAEAPDRDELLGHAERYLQAVEERVRSARPGVKVELRALAPGNVVGSLVREVRKSEAELVVMSTHGRGGLRRAWLGSVSDGLIRKSPRPVLLVRPRDADGPSEEPPAEGVRGEAEPFRRILVPLDGSDAASAILEPTAELARLDGAGLTLVHVLPAARVGAYPYMTRPAGEDELPEEVVRSVREELETDAEWIRERGIPVDVRLVQHDRPAVAVLEEAERAGADLVALSTRGRGGVARLLVGSVADKVIRGSVPPVLVHRPVGEEED